MLLEVLSIIFLLLLGLVLIIKFGDYFVDGATWVAEVSGIPKFIVGATIVSVATTLPEIMVSLISARSAPDMAIGNAVGSVVFNTGVIMAIALIAQPFYIKRKDYAFKGLLLFITMLLISLFSFKGVDILNINKNTLGMFGYISSVIVFSLFVVYILENVYSAKKNAGENVKEKPKATKRSLLINLSKLIAGAAGIAIGSILLKNNAAKLAEIAGIPQAVIGVTILAIGTSLPELVTMIIAVKKGESSLSVGNIIGANTIDLAFILPMSAFITMGNGLPVANIHLLITMPITLLIIAIAIIPTLISKKFSRWQGGLMISIYGMYFIYNVVYAIV